MNNFKKKKFKKKKILKNFFLLNFSEKNRKISKKFEYFFFRLFVCLFPFVYLRKRWKKWKIGFPHFPPLQDHPRGDFCGWRGTLNRPSTPSYRPEARHLATLLLAAPFVGTSRPLMLIFCVTASIFFLNVLPAVFGIWM